MIKDAITLLVDNDKFAFELPSTPGFEISTWVASQSQSPHVLLKRARKSTVPVAMADDHETQPWSCMEGMPELDTTQDSTCA